ncbi:hypothetical protein [Paraburkholderia bannensis]|uniref:hypothetical protein n=1 Tax=Paraburkholderia bannensis TaxID=765414 RepID=UPI000486D063|nr:hypothetical protein [Paraburkholderia bannensis]
MSLRVSTKATLAVARKLIENVVKGNPAFKPYKGEHGNASWFLIDGDPHTGVANQGKDVIIWAEIDNAFVQTDDSLVEEQISAVRREQPGLIDRAPKEFDLTVWNKIGAICSARTKATNLKVPSCKLSVNPGRFLVLPPSVSHALTIDFKRLDSDNLALFSAENFSYETYKEEREKYESNKNNMDKVITVWIGPFRGPEDRARRDIRPIYEKVKKDIGNPKIKISFHFRIFTFTRIGWVMDPNAPKTEQVDGHYCAVSLTYMNYRDAKNAFRKILINHDGNQKIHCFAGSDWHQEGKDRATSVTGKAYSGAVEDTVFNATYTNF